MSSRLRFLFFFFGFVCCAFCPLISAADCPPLSQELPERITAYLAHRLVSGQNVRPSITEITTLPGSCYHKLTIAIPNAPNQLVMYLSPDERFLTSTLYDLSVDPQKEVARIAENVEKLLMRDESPGISGSAARIRVVEFVDFQCPYCKRFAEWYAALPEALRNQTILVMKHLPLDQHPWARTAAYYSICTERQSRTAFRYLLHFLFASQGEITSETIKDKVMLALSQFPDVKLQELVACVSGSDVAGIVDRDIVVARQLDISSTPTVFINGRRILPMHSAEELQRLLEGEAQRNPAITTPTGETPTEK